MKKSVSGIRRKRDRKEIYVKASAQFFGQRAQKTVHSGSFEAFFHPKKTELKKEK